MLRRGAARRGARSVLMPAEQSSKIRGWVCSPPRTLSGLDAGDAVAPEIPTSGIYDMTTCAPRKKVAKQAGFGESTNGKKQHVVVV